VVEDSIVILFNSDMVYGLLVTLLRTKSSETHSISSFYGLIWHPCALVQVQSICLNLQFHLSLMSSLYEWIILEGMLNYIQPINLDQIEFLLTERKHYWGYVYKKPISKRKSLNGNSTTKNCRVHLGIMHYFLNWWWTILNLCNIVIKGL
jgi:hypothetical protein